MQKNYENASNVGSFEVKVPATSNGTADIANGVTTLITTFKFETPYPYDHAMYCMPRGMVAIASGNDNAWLSTYNDETYWNSMHGPPFHLFKCM
jgi:hypothetical protein